MVNPKEGTALFFVHSTHHKGEPVKIGRKYVLRTDVMYASEEDWEQNHEHPEDEW